MTCRTPTWRRPSSNWKTSWPSRANTAILASAKEGIGIDEILEAIVERIPAPKPTGAPSLQALGFDSYFDTYKGVVTHVRVFNGELQPGMHVKLLHSGKNVEVKEVGSFNPKPYSREKLEVGRNRLHDGQHQKPARKSRWATRSRTRRNPSPALPGFKEIHPMVFSGIYPINTADYEHLKANLAQAAAQRLGFRVIRRKVPSRSASASAAVFSACCIWKSSRNASAANTTWTSSPLIPAWFTA